MDKNNQDEEFYSGSEDPEATQNSQDEDENEDDEDNEDEDESSPELFLNTVKLRRNRGTKMEKLIKMQNFKEDEDFWAENKYFESNLKN